MSPGLTLLLLLLLLLRSRLKPNSCLVSFTSASSLRLQQPDQLTAVHQWLSASCVCARDC
jgi:hypothetical protein